MKAKVINNIQRSPINTPFVEGGIYINNECGIVAMLCRIDYAGRFSMICLDKEDMGNRYYGLMSEEELTEMLNNYWSIVKNATIIVEGE